MKTLNNYIQESIFDNTSIHTKINKSLEQDMVNWADKHIVDVFSNMKFSQIYKCELIENSNTIGIFTPEDSKYFKYYDDGLCFTNIQSKKDLPPIKISSIKLGNENTIRFKNCSESVLDDVFDKNWTFESASYTKHNFIFDARDVCKMYNLENLPQNHSRSLNDAYNYVFINNLFSSSPKKNNMHEVASGLKNAKYIDDIFFDECGIYLPGFTITQKMIDDLFDSNLPAMVGRNNVKIVEYDKTSKTSIVSIKIGYKSNISGWVADLRDYICSIILKNLNPKSSSYIYVKKNKGIDVELLINPKNSSIVINKMMF